MNKFRQECQFGCSAFKRLKEYYMNSKDLEHRVLYLENKVKELENRISSVDRTNVGSFYSKEIKKLVDSHIIIGSSVAGTCNSNIEFKHE